MGKYTVKPKAEQAPVQQPQSQAQKQMPGIIYDKKGNPRVDTDYYKNFYSVDGILGCAWAMFYVLIGSRQCGKSFSVMNYCLKQWDRYGTPFIWIRLSAASKEKMLAANAGRLVDAKLVRKYGLELKSSIKTGEVFDISRDPEKKHPMCKVLALSEFAKEKGVAYYDSGYKGVYNIVCDEFILEKNEVRRFDVLYNLIGSLENQIRDRKEGVRIFLICNLSEEANEVLSNGFGFLPAKFGRYKLKRKRCVIDYIEPTEQYVSFRKGTVADILTQEQELSVFNNQIQQDLSVIDKKKRLERCEFLIKFDTSKNTWFCLYDEKYIVPYHGETVGKDRIIAMKPYLNERFEEVMRDVIIERFDKVDFKFKTLKDYLVFKRELSKLKPRGNRSL